MSCSISSTETSAGSAAMASRMSRALGLGHAGRRLVEQQHLGRAGEGRGDLEQALLAVGQGVGAPFEHVGEAEALGNLQ